MWISIATGMTTRLDLEILLENSGSVSDDVYSFICAGDT